MGLFGVPVVHEDDALRAIRAAVELRDALATEDTPLCIGIDTGEVLTGDPTSGERLVTGAAADRAAFLQQSGPQGGIVIGDATLSLVRDAVRVEPSEPDATTAGSTPAWRLLELLPGAPPFLRRFDAPLVGREGELASASPSVRAGAAGAARAAVHRLRRGRDRQDPTRAGAARSVAGEASVLTGRCLSYGEGITYWPVREIVAEAAGDRSLRDLLDGIPEADVVAARPGERDRFGHGRGGQRGDLLGGAQARRGARPRVAARARLRGCALGRADTARPGRAPGGLGARRAVADCLSRAAGAARRQAGLGRWQAECEFDPARAALRGGVVDADRRARGQRAVPAGEPAHCRGRGRKPALSRADARPARRRRGWSARRSDCRLRSRRCSPLGSTGSSPGNGSRSSARRSKGRRSMWALSPSSRSWSRRRPSAPAC